MQRIFSTKQNNVGHNLGIIIIDIYIFLIIIIIINIHKQIK